VTRPVQLGRFSTTRRFTASFVAPQIGGQLFSAVDLAGLVVAPAIPAWCAQWAAIPPCQGGLRQFSEKFHTSVVNLAITGIGLIAVFLDVATSTKLGLELISGSMPLVVRKV